MAFAVNVVGWVGVVALLAAYWLVSTQKARGDSATYQGMNLVGAVLVLVNSSYYGAYPSVGVNAAWIAIGAYALAMHRPGKRGRDLEPHEVLPPTSPQGLCGNPIVRAKRRPPR
jgi:hypothetical protein